MGWISRVNLTSNKLNMFQKLNKCYMMAIEMNEQVYTESCLIKYREQI